MEPVGKATVAGADVSEQVEALLQMEGVLCTEHVRAGQQLNWFFPPQ